mgnify:CR=1 FL=1
MRVVFRLPNEEIVELQSEATISTLASEVAISTLAIGHTIELRGSIFEIIGVRLVPEFSKIIVTLDDTGGRSTMPPPPGP